MANDENGEMKEKNNTLKNKLKVAEQKNKTMEANIEKSKIEMKSLEITITSNLKMRNLME